LFILLGVIIAVVIVVTNKNDDDDVKATTVKPTTTLKPGAARMFAKAAVASDAQKCSKIGKDILKMGGSAVDSAVATLFCTGLFNMESCGIGGGGFMNVYIRATKKSIIYDYRETAPAAATKDMFLNKSSVFGGLPIGIPGNIKGMHYVWQKHGVLQWKDLIQPTIDIATTGFIVTKSAGGTIPALASVLNKSPGFRHLLKKPDGSWIKAGDTIKNPQLAETLKIIRDNPDDFYTGELAKQIVKDVQEAGGIITLDDLKNYTVQEREPLENVINGNKYLLMPPPGSATVIGMALNILKGFNFSKDSYNTDEKKVITMHRFVEALKFAFARRPFLGDPSFEKNMTVVLNSMLNQTFAETLRLKIKEDGVYHNQTFYGGYYSQKQMPYGTSHISILAENGDAVSATDTINYDYGGGIRSNITGIIFNNEMDDFSTPGKPNVWGYLPAPANYIVPGKRPLSSMSPTLVLDDNDDVIMVVGGSGGSRIISGTLITLFRKMLLQMDLGDAIGENRVHTHLLPNDVYINKNAPIKQFMKDGLIKLGHKVVESNLGVAIQAIYREGAGKSIYAKSDPRKGGVSEGI